MPIPVSEMRPEVLGKASPDWLEELLASLPVSGDTWLASRQQRARLALAAARLPSRRQEDWRFTDIAAITALPAHPLETELEPAALPAAPAGVLRLLLDGRSDPLAGLTLPEGLERLTTEQLEPLLSENAAREDGANPPWSVLLNGSLATQVLALRVSQAAPIVLELVSDTAAAAGVLGLHLLLILEPEASLEVLEVHRASGASLTSVLLEARLGRGAHLRHGLLAQGLAPKPANRDLAEAAWIAPVLLHHLAATQEPASELELVAAVSGFGLARLEPTVVQSNGAALTRLRGLQRANGNQVVDTHSRVLFSGPEGRLDQLHKALADGASRSVFNGAVIVPREAQRTDAAQLSRSLLLSDRARIDTKPELEIVADDVRCAHGATVSRLQQDELFYLQSRGIGAAQAAQLLVRGFCEEVLSELPGPASHWQPLESLLAADPAR